MKQGIEASSENLKQGIEQIKAILNERKIAGIVMIYEPELTINELDQKIIRGHAEYLIHIGSETVPFSVIKLKEDGSGITVDENIDYTLEETKDNLNITENMVLIFSKIIEPIQRNLLHSRECFEWIFKMFSKNKSNR